MKQIKQMSGQLITATALVLVPIVVCLCAFAILSLLIALFFSVSYWDVMLYPVMLVLNFIITLTTVIMCIADYCGQFKTTTI